MNPSFVSPGNWPWNTASLDTCENAWEPSERDPFRQTRDGKWVLILALNPQSWERPAQAMERPELPQDSRFCDPASRLQNKDALHGIIREWVASLNAEALYRCLEEWRVPFGTVNSIVDIFMVYCSIRRVGLEVERQMTMCREARIAIANPIGVTRQAWIKLVCDDRLRQSVPT